MRSRLWSTTAAIAATAAIVVAGVSPAGAAQPGPAGFPIAGDATSTTVAGSGMVPNAPTDHYTDAAGATNSVSSAAAVNLPFNYTFNVQFTLDSRDFFPSNGRACVNATVTSGFGEQMLVELYDFFQVGPDVHFTTNGSNQQFCFTGLNNSEDYFFRITHESGGSALVGFGSVTG